MENKEISTAKEYQRRQPFYEINTSVLSLYGGIERRLKQGIYPNIDVATYTDGRTRKEFIELTFTIVERKVIELLQPLGWKVKSVTFEPKVFLAEENPRYNFGEPYDNPFRLQFYRTPVHVRFDMDFLKEGEDYIRLEQVRKKEAELTEQIFAILGI